MKKVLAVFLSVLLAAAMFPVSAFAAATWTTAPDISVSVSVDNTNSTVTATVQVQPYTNMAGVVFHLNYDNTKLSVAGTVPAGGKYPSGIVFGGIVAAIGPTVNYLSGSYIGVSATNTNTYTSATAQTLMTVTFNINAGATGGAAFTLDTLQLSNDNDELQTNPGGTHSVGVLLSAPNILVDLPVKYAPAQTTISAGTGYTGSIQWNPTPPSGAFLAGTAYTATVTLTAASNYQFNTNQTVTVNAAAPTSYITQSTSTVSFTKTFSATEAASLTNIALTPSNPASLAVPNSGSTAYQQFTATGNDNGQNYDISGSTTWSIVDSGTHNAVTYTGISVNTSGKLSISSAAAANTFINSSLTVTVKAASGGQTAFQNITVTRIDSAATTVTVSGGQSNIIVPVSGAAANTSTKFTATVYDQYGIAMNGQTIDWTVLNVNAAVTGVDISDGAVTVATGASGTVTDATGISLTVTAKVSGTSVSGTGSVTVKRAAQLATTIEIDGPSAMIVPADGAGNNQSTCTATVKDQYGTVMNGQSVTWTITSGGTTKTGVTIPGGVVTVANSAKGTVANTTGTVFTVTATDGSASQTYDITVKRDTAVYNRIEIVRTSVVHGTSTAAGTDLLVIPQKDSTDYTYIATVYDQYGAVMTDNSGAWTGTIGSAGGITQTGAKVTVSSAATAASPAGTLIYTEGVSGNHNTATVAISLSTLLVDWSGVSVSSETSKVYGAATTFASFVTLPTSASGTASDGATAVSGTFSVVNGSTLANHSDTTVTVRFTVTSDGSYKNLYFDKTYAIKVGKCPLTVTPTSGQSKVYGTTDPTLTYSFAGNVAGQTPGFSGALSREDGSSVGSNYGISTGTLALIDTSTFKADNYQLSLTTGVKFSITPATIAITATAPSNTVLANDAANTSTSALKAIANGGSALPSTVAISYSSGQTGTIGITWAESAQIWNAKGGTYYYIGTVASDSNYANRPTLTATVTVTAVTVTAAKQDSSTNLTTAITVARADVLKAATLAVIGVPSTAYITFNNSVTALSGQSITWDKDILAVQTVAGTVSDTSGDKTIVLSVLPVTYPNWATAPVTAPTLTITITNKYPVNVTFTTPINDITYGDTLSVPVAAQNAITNGIDTSANATFTYSYVGTNLTTYGPSATAPTKAGTYKVIATLTSDTHSGTGEDAFTISKKALTTALITGITPATNTYTGSAINPVPTVTDATGPITASDYVVSWQSNTNAGTAAKVIITATASGNYSGTAEYTFIINKAALSGTPTISGIAAVGNVLTANQSYPESQITYQWTRGGTDISGATYKTYTLVDADSNKSIGVKVTGADVNYLKSSTITSTAVTVAKKTVTGTVVLTGGSSPVVIGDTLTADITGIQPDQAQSGATYKWTATTSAGVKTDLGISATQALSGLAADTVVTVTVTPGSDYSGTLTASVTIGKTPLTATLELSSGSNDVGSVITPTGTVNGAAISDTSADYTLQWMRNGTDISNAAGATYTVTKADLGTTLTLKAVGKGSYTGTILATGDAAVDASYPDAPIISANAGNGQVTVNWSAPAANGSPITGYTLLVKAGTGDYDSGTLLASDATSYTVTNLANGTLYTFKLYAINEVDASYDSNEVTATPSAPAYNNGGSGNTSSNQNKVDISGPGGSANVSVNVTGTSVAVTTDDSSLSKIFGQGSTGGAVNLDISSVGTGVNEVTFQNNFVTALQTAVSNGNTSSVTVALPGGSSIELDKNVLKTICDAAGTGGLSIGVVPVAASSLPSAMQGALTGQNVGAIYEISITSGRTEISSLGGTATITFAVTVGSDVKSAKVYKVYPDGTTELVKSEVDLATGEVTIERHSLSTYAVVFSDKPAWVNPYTDVAIGQWFYEDAEYISQNSLMNGVTTTAFDPSGTTTRAMVATVLWRLAGSPSSTAANPFSDVQAGTWYTSAVAWAADKGIVTGLGGGLFNPNANVTREEFATMLYRYAKYKGIDVSSSTSANISAFSDSSQTDSYAVSAITWANSQGIIKGRTATTLEPLGFAQRAELAAMLHRFAVNNIK